MLDQLIPPDEGFAAALYRALKESPAGELTLDMLSLEPQDRERAGILFLYCDQQHGFGEWNERIAPKEIERNCQNANHEYLRRKQQDMTRKLLEARKNGDAKQEEGLLAEYQEVLKLSRAK